jgi:hypothetical protein
VKVPADATWDQVILAWLSQVDAEGIDLKRYPGAAAAYVFKSESGDPVVSMDGINRVFAHYLPAMVQAPKEVVSQPASDGMVMSTVVRHALTSDRKYVKKNARARVLPSETEWDLLNRWFVDLHNSKVKVTDVRKRYLERRPKEASYDKWYSGDMHPLEEPWWDQEIVIVKDPNRSSTEPVSELHLLGKCSMNIRNCIRQVDRQERQEQDQKGENQRDIMRRTTQPRLDVNKGKLTW